MMSRLWGAKRKCKIEDACRAILSEYPRDIPDRCDECTDLVKFTVSCLILDGLEVKEVDIWNE